MCFREHLLPTHFAGGRRSFASPSGHAAVDWSWVADVCQSPARGGEKSDGVAPLGGPRPGLVLLNTPLSRPRLLQLWYAAEFRACADGAANRLAAAGGGAAGLTPDVLVGDFDSVKPEVAALYEARGTILHNLAHDQESTDLEKCMAKVHEAGCERVIVAGQFAGVAGRLDHTFGIVSSLHLWPDLRVVVVGDDSFMLLLAPGEHTLLVPNASCAPHCGLVPIGSACASISTTGLQYNMTDTAMAFGALISTSNRVDPLAGGRIWVRTSHHVLWTCTLAWPAL